MIPVTTMAGRRVALFGLGGSGLATATALAVGGADVAAWDDAEEARAAAAAGGIAIVDLRIADWARFDALVLAPGVPFTHPAPHWTVVAAQAAAVPIIGDIELFVRERRAHAPDCPLVAITGTNGKSTTTALTAHLLAAAGRDVQMGGNIGRAALTLAPPQAGRTFVLECSSFQIDLAPSLDPSVGVLLNVSPDHLDRHGTMENYAAVKERLVAGARVAVVGVDDDWSAAIADRLERQGKPVRRLSVRRPLADGYILEGTRLVRVAGGAAEAVADLGGIGSLRGRHNAQNAAAAVAAATALGLGDGQIAAALKTFPGLAHRMEEVGRHGRVLFVNDSKATNADSAAQALASFQRIYWIVGGKPKADGIAPLHPFFARIAKAYLIGEAAEAFAETLAGRVTSVRAGDLGTALGLAAADAAADPHPEPVVLLSPACASYDQFRNFEARGDAFRNLVLALGGAPTKASAPAVPA